MELAHGGGRGALLALALALASPVATAEDAGITGRNTREWQPFMGDDAHAIHRTALKTRRDGLLESASRYPRTSLRGWSPEQNRRGHYEYLERLIDCRTGLYVDTALSLLDADNRPIARRELGYDDQIEQIALRQDEVEQHVWPLSSEIAMACAMVANPHLDTDALPLREVPATGFDYESIGDAPPADARGLFARLRAQYDIYLADHIPAQPRDPLGPTAAPHQGTRWLEPMESYDDGAPWSRFDLASLRHRGDGALEISAWTSRVKRWPYRLSEDAEVEVTLMIDCRNGLSVPVEQRFHASLEGASGQDQPQRRPELLRRSAPVFTTLQEVAQEGTRWSEWQGPAKTSDMARLCELAAQRCGAAKHKPLFELAPERLAHQPGAPLLLSARALWLEHRAGFVPSCPIGAR